MRSISHSPTKVKIRFVTPTPTDWRSAALAPRPVSSKILGAKYRMAVIPESWLKKATNTASRMGRGTNLGDIKLRHHRRNPDAEPPDEAREDERAHAACEGAADRRDDIERPDANQRGLAAEPVGRPAAEKGADHGAIEGRGQGESVQGGAELPLRLDRLFRA